MQESCTYGSMRGAPSNGRPYRNLKMALIDGASDGAAHIGGHYTKVLADANSVACLREREH